MQPCLLGIGLAAPESQITAAEGYELARQVAGDHDQDWLRALYLDSGVSTRGSIMTAESMRASCMENNGSGPTTSARLQQFSVAAPRLAEAAVRRAFEQSGVGPLNITHLVTVSCTGAESPGLDHALIERLSLNYSVSRTHLGFMGCHGALNGLAVANAFVRADPSALVLVVCCELCSLHYQTGVVTRDQLIANAIFADGASCAIVGAEGSGPALHCFGSRVFDGTSDLMRWHIGDHGFQMHLSARVPVMLRRVIAPWIDEWLGSNDFVRSDVTRWCIHPGGRDILDCVEQGLEIGPASTSISRDVYCRRGNMSSSTVLWVVESALQSEGDGPMIVMSFGPGLSGEALLLA